MCQLLSYEGLKKIAANDATAQENLEDIKFQFRKEIGSDRNMYRIKTMADLIDCLERHDALSEFNVEPLREIADEYGGSLEEAVSCYQAPKEISKTHPANEYRQIRLAHEAQIRTNISGIRNDSYFINGSNTNNYISPVAKTVPAQQPPLAQPLSSEKRSAIYKLIAQNIGTFWRSFGRELNMSQGDMDEIEIQFPRDLKSRVYKLFQVFEEDDSVDPKEHLLLICRALDECRRKDLRRKIESIMSH